MKVFNKATDVIPRGAIYIGRPSKWGNPFHLDIHGNRKKVLRLYREWLLGQPELIAAAKQELAGKNLVCWCRPKACHGDILIEVITR